MCITLDPIAHDSCLRFKQIPESAGLVVETVLKTEVFGLVCFCLSCNTDYIEYFCCFTTRKNTLVPMSMVSNMDIVQLLFDLYTRPTPLSKRECLLETHSRIEPKASKPTDLCPAEKGAMHPTRVAFTNVLSKSLKSPRLAALCHISPPAFLNALKSEFTDYSKYDTIALNTFRTYTESLIVQVEHNKAAPLLEKSH